MPLKGIKVIELCGLAPAPFLGLILSDFGAKVIRIDNLNRSNGEFFSLSKNSMYLNLKAPKGVEILNRLTDKSDVLIEPFRPGVMERLSLGPDKLLKTNPSLIYTRLSGFGQTGPLARQASHDINFLALSGCLSRFGYPEKPPQGPMNLLADIGGGSILCALGIMMALFERTKSGKGQIIDHSMTEGVGYLSSFIWESMRQKDVLWPNWPKRGSNLLDYGAPFYRCYECSDGKYLAVGALEEKFYLNFLKALGLDEERFNRFDVDSWSEIADEMAKIVKTKTRDEWAKIFEKEEFDACVTPVLELDEVAKYPHNKERKSFDDVNGYPNPAPKLSRTPAIGQRNGWPDINAEIESNAREILQEFGFSSNEINQLEPEIVE